MRQWAPQQKFVGIAVVQDGCANADPKFVAERLVQHWQPIFSSKPVDKELMQWWMSRIKKPDLNVQWQIFWEDFQDFVCHLRDSAAGPDGLVYGAYRNSPLSKVAL